MIIHCNLAAFFYSRPKLGVSTGCNRVELNAFEDIAYETLKAVEFRPLRKEFSLFWFRLSMEY